jgi:hypothetical protein
MSAGLRPFLGECGEVHNFLSELSLWPILKIVYALVEENSSSVCEGEQRIDSIWSHSTSAGLLRFLLPRLFSKNRNSGRAGISSDMCFVRSARRLSSPSASISKRAADHKAS